MTSLISKINSIKVSHKLYLGFGIVLLLVVIASGLSVQRFKAIRDIYEKTNLIYNINIDVFQVKINRVKYLYTSDDAVRKVMAGFIDHASTLTRDAQALSWDKASLESLNNIAQYLGDFNKSLENMGTFSKKMVEIRAQLDDLQGRDAIGPFKTALLNQTVGTDLDNKLNDFVLSFVEIKGNSYNLQLKGNDEALSLLQKNYAAAEKKYNDLAVSLTPEQKPHLDALWAYVGKYKDLSEIYYTDYKDLNTAENGVKTAGDKSSAAVKVIINIVKEKNDALAYGSSSITIIIGLIAVIFGILVSWYITRQITRPVLGNLAVAERIANGDLTASITPDRHDELGQLTAAMARMNAKLRHIISDVRDSVATVASSAAKIAMGNTDLSSRTEQQAAAVVETAASMEELTSTVKNNADNAKHASLIAGEATQNAHQGGEVMKNVVRTMDDISSSSKKITDITAVINSIAFQTNILALNAAVEAARAGEQGRGFAVVASEVRNLSQRSSQAAKEIATLIGESVSRIDVGTKLVAQAGDTMEQIVASVSRVNDIMGEISSASEEQSHGIEQIARAISELDTTTQQNAALVTESSIAANTLEDQSAVLEKLVASFRL
ncbi:methyl-accepting chemotaxis protein [Acerihabitans arboris]|uniref:HAMP domain-containing protein n=1 Tax=Acerihabitans arboris TaxID=2691583 RepID=A0A845SS32_9GAMM|nr:methyl-accepting chemotaxis protein [Acerihabitans arboris]NDL65478.1 HAMP domain-containing protein [Acerihabitans arboris]